MISNHIKLDTNFKYLLLLPYVFWLILICIYIFNSDLIKAGELSGLVMYGNDSSRYINDAKKLLNFEHSIESMLRRGKWSKREVVNLFNEVLPNFKHVETTQILEKNRIIRLNDLKISNFQKTHIHQ